MATIAVRRFQFFVDRPGVMRRVGKKKLKVLSRTGAYGRGAMRKSFRPMLKRKAERRVTVGGKQYFVPAQGHVLDLTTGRKARTSEAQGARDAYFRQYKPGQGEGKPPRQGPTKKLKTFTDFGVDPSTESVVIGAFPFADQPRLLGAVTVPQLLDKGGGEYIGSQLVKYGKRPFTEPITPLAFRKMGELIERTPL